MLRLKGILILSLVFVWELGCGGGSLQTASRSPNPTPSPLPSPQANISISPANIIVGSADLTLTIMASATFSFPDAGHKVSKVFWSANGTDTQLTASFVSTSELTAIVPAPLLTSPLQASLRVEVWDIQGDAPSATSSSVPFRVTTAPPAVPSIASISPASTQTGSPDVTITINGSNFGRFGHVWSTVFWTTNGNLHDTGTWLQTTIISSSQLTAVIPTKLLQSPTSAQILVMNGDIMGMSDGYFGYPRSESFTFTVTP